MLTSSVEPLTPEERDLVTQSFHPQRFRRRIQGVLLSTSAVLAAVFALSQLGFTVVWFASVAVVVLIISAIEKVTYHQTMQRYETLIFKLTHQVEALEGQPQTPEDADPYRMLTTNNNAPLIVPTAAPAQK